MAGSPPTQSFAAAPAPGTLSASTPEERVAARRAKERAKHAAARAAGKEPTRTRAERRAAQSAATGVPPPKVKQGRPNKVTVATVSDALAKTGGLIGVSAQLLKVERRTVQKYVERYASLQEVRDQSKEQALDQTEWALIKAAKNGEPWAVQWFLKYQGKARGYQEVRKTEQESTVKVEVEYTQDALNAGRPNVQTTTVTQLPPPTLDSADGSAERSRYEQRIEIVEAEVSYPDRADPLPVVSEAGAPVAPEVVE